MKLALVSQEWRPEAATKAGVENDGADQDYSVNPNLVHWHLKCASRAGTHSLSIVAAGKCCSSVQLDYKCAQVR